MNIPELIRRKRDGDRLDPAEIADFIAGVAANEVEDAQLGAFLMAVYLRGMSDAEQAAPVGPSAHGRGSACWAAVSLGHASGIPSVPL